jgi:internalin A
MSKIAMKRPPVLHLSTWFVIAAATVVVLLANVPGEMSWRFHDPLRLGRTMPVIEHGFPLTYARRDVVGSVSTVSAPWRMSDNLVWTSWFNLSVDGVAGAAAIVAAGWAFERWRRRRTRLWQFSLAECLLMMALIAGGSAWWASERRHHDKLCNLAAGFGARSPGISSRLPFWLRMLVGDDRLSALKVSRANWLALDLHVDDAQFRRLRELVQVSPETVEVQEMVASGPGTGERLKQLPRLRWLQISDYDEAVLSALGTLRELEFLDVMFPAHGSVYPAGMSALAKLNAPNLRALTIDADLPPNDGTLAAVEPLRRLEALCFDDRGMYDAGQPRITNAGLASLARLPHLRSLSLPRSLIDDEGARQLARFPNLESLALSHTAVGDAGVEELAAITGLVYLDLGGTNITDAGVAQLPRLDRLVELNLAETRVTDAGVSCLARCPSLRHLNLAGTHITDAALESLRPLDHLESLSLRETAVADLTALKGEGFAELSWLDVTNSPVSSATLAAVAARHPGIQTFVWRGLPKVTYDEQVAQVRRGEISAMYAPQPSVVPDLAALAGLTQLTWLHLAKSHLGDDALAQLGAVGNLRRLSLRHTHITDDGLSQIHQLSELTELDLANTRVTTAGLRHLARLPRLESLTLDRWQAADALDELRQLMALKKLRVIDSRSADHSAALVRRLAESLPIVDVARQRF